MTEKKLAIVAYLTIIGWVIAYLLYGKAEKTGLLRYHLKQGFGLVLLSIGLGVIIKVVSLVSPAAARMIGWAGILIFIFAVLGIINALNETQKPIPVIGGFFENKFSFIS